MSQDVQMARERAHQDVGLVIAKLQAALDNEDGRVDLLGTVRDAKSTLEWADKRLTYVNVETYKEQIGRQA
jgi:hypothetical protein